MTCEQCRDRISDLLEGDLGPAEELEVRAHSSGCAECGRALEETQLIVRALRETPELEPPAELRERLRGIPEVASPQVAGFWSRRRYVMAGVAAAAAAMLIVWAGLDYQQRRMATDATMQPQVVAERHALEQDVLPEDATESDEAPDPEAEHIAQEADAPQMSGDPAVISAPEAPAPTRRDARPGRSTPSPAEVEGTRIAEVPVEVEAPQPQQPRVPVRSAPAERPEIVDAAADRTDEATEAGVPGHERVAVAEDELTAPVTGTLPMPRAVYLDTPEVISARVGEGTPFTIAVRPPDARMTGKVVAATIVLETERDVARAKVNVRGSEGLELIGLATDGLVFDGPLKAGQETVLSVQMMARAADEYSIGIRVRSTDPIVDTSLDVSLGRFAEMVPPAERLVQFDFTGTPVSDAVAEIVRDSGMRVIVDHDVGDVTVTVLMVEAIPARAALQVVADAAGCKLVEVDGKLMIRPAGEEP